MYWLSTKHNKLAVAERWLLAEVRLYLFILIEHRKEFMTLIFTRNIRDLFCTKMENVTKFLAMIKPSVHEMLSTTTTCLHVLIYRLGYSMYIILMQY